MKRKRLYFLVVLIIFFTGCDELNLSDNENYSIEFGTECGRCAGSERIMVSSSVLKYERIIPCGQDKSTVNKDRKFTEAEWTKLKNSFSYGAYLLLKYNECHVCYDGCDEIIKITLNDSTHELKYLPGKNIKEIESLQNQLKVLMEEMQKK